MIVTGKNAMKRNGTMDRVMKLLAELRDASFLWRTAFALSFRSFMLVSERLSRG